MAQVERRISLTKPQLDAPLPLMAVPRRAAHTASLHTRPSAVAQLRRRIRRTPVALVTSRDRQGALHTRPMVASDREFDGELWFATSLSAPVVDHVLACPQIQVTYADSTSNRNLILDGIAHVCRGAELARALWQSEFAALFPRGPTDVELAFICVEIVSADVWE